MATGGLESNSGGERHGRREYLTQETSSGRPLRLQAKIFLTCSLLLLALASPIALLGVRSGDTTGAVLIAGHCVDLLSGLALLVLCAAVGQPFVSSITEGQDRQLERLAFGLAIGLGITAAALLGAVAALGVHPWVLALTILLLTAVSRRQVPAVLALV